MAFLFMSHNKKQNEPSKRLVAFLRQFKQYFKKLDSAKDFPAAAGTGGESFVFSGGVPGGFGLAPGLPSPGGDGCRFRAFHDYQFYFIGRSKTYARGCGTGSGSREVHSYFGLAFLELTRRGESVPSHILIHDKHNRVLLAKSLKSFALYPAFMGSNCSESRETVQKLLPSGLAVTAIASDDYSEIRELKIK